MCSNDDLTTQSSINNWKEKIKNNIDDIPIIVVNNKTDINTEESFSDADCDISVKNDTGIVELLSYMYNQLHF